MKLMLIAALAAAAPAFAQLQLSALDGLAAKARESVEITLDAATLKLAGPMFGRTQDPEAFSQMLGKLKGITVRSYEFTGANQYDPSSLQPLRDQLKGQGWSKMIAMKEGQRESFELYSRVDSQGKIMGFAMIAAEPNELAVIHIDGPIELNELAAMGGRLGIPRIPNYLTPQPKSPFVVRKDAELKLKSTAKTAEARAKAEEKAAETKAKAAAKAKKGEF